MCLKVATAAEIWWLLEGQIEAGGAWKHWGGEEEGTWFAWGGHTDHYLCERISGSKRCTVQQVGLLVTDLPDSTVKLDSGTLLALACTASSANPKRD